MPIRMDIDLPDRVAGVTLPQRHRSAPAHPGRLQRRGRSQRRRPRPAGRDPPSWRPDLVQPADLVEEVLRLEGLEQIPSVLPAAPAGRGLTPRSVASARVSKAVRSRSGLRRGPSAGLPAHQRLRRLGPRRGRSAPHHQQGAQPARSRSSGAGDHAAARVCWRSWLATLLAVSVIFRCTASRRSCCRAPTPSRSMHCRWIVVRRTSRSRT